MSAKKYELQKRACPLCGEAVNVSLIDRRRVEQNGAEYAVSECKRCSFIHQNPAWDQSFYDALYADLVYDPSGHKYYPAQIARYEAVADTIEKLVAGKNNQKILDFGCYDGSFIAWLKAEKATWAQEQDFTGYDIYLKEISPGSEFYNSLTNLQKTGKLFDIIVFNHVVEHVLKPVPYLQFIKDNFLADGGHVVIEVPNISFVRRDEISPYHLQHTNYFSPLTISILLKMAGLAVEKITTFKNYDISRDPHFPTLLAVGQKSQEFIKDGETLKERVASNQKKFVDKLKKLGKDAKVGIVGCGDPLHLVSSLLPANHKLIYLFDNNKLLWGRKLLDIEVKPVAEASEAKLDYLIICTLHEHNVRQLQTQLSKIIDPKKLVTIFDID